MLNRTKLVPQLSRSPYALAMKLDLACRMLELPPEARQSLRNNTSDIVRLLGELESDVSARPMGKSRVGALLHTGVGRLKDCRALLHQALHESEEVNRVLVELDRFFATALGHVA